MQTTRETILAELKSYEHVCLVGPLVNPKKFNPIDCPHLLIDGGCLVKELLTPSYPNWTIGDGDSGHFKMDLLLNCEKNFSDLKATLECLPPEIKKVTLKGLIGGRKDHEFINFGVIHHFLSSRNNTRCDFEENIIAYTAGSIELNLNGTFSILFFEQTSLEILGNIKYKLSPATLIPALSSHTLSNEGHGRVQINSNKPFFIFKEEDDE